MIPTIPDVVTVKNHWLKSHVDVEYPTQESLLGCQRYFSESDKLQYQILSRDASVCVTEEVAVYPVDFHRLTILFALLQSSRFSEEDQRQSVIEFLTQIIYSPPCDLYLGFVAGEPVLAGIVTRTPEAVLVSDLVVDRSRSSLSKLDAGWVLYNYLSLDSCAQCPVYIEC